MKHLFRTAIRTIGALGVLFVSATTAHALTITPVRIEIKGDPGQVLTEEMTLIRTVDWCNVLFFLCKL